MDWTPYACKQLSALWDMGLTASQIGAEFGISRSAVLGKARRLNLFYRVIRLNGSYCRQRVVNGELVIEDFKNKRRRSYYRASGTMTTGERLRRNEYQRKWREKQNAKPRKRMSRAESMQLADEERARTKWSAFEASPDSIGILELTNETCRWPQGEDPVRYCGCCVTENSPYCEQHHRMAFQCHE